MFSGGVAMLEASMRWQRAAPAVVYGLTFIGFAVCIGGWFLRRSALRPTGPSPRNS